MSTTKVEFDHSGIGKALATHRLTVPPNQREYAWRDEEVEELFQDFAANMPTGRYFLGTVVLTRGENGLEIADGQQRLATTTILIASIRDYLLLHNNEPTARSIEQEFLSVWDRDSQVTMPRLLLNMDDRDFFRRHIIERPDSPGRKDLPATDSGRRLAAAARRASDFVETLVAPLKEPDHRTLLNRWIKFLSDGVEIVVLTTPDYLDAFAMFETLNDRGLKASQADLIKNYVLSQAGSRRAEAQQRWSQMLGILESLRIPDLTVPYLRHVIITKEGPTKERYLFVRVRTRINSEATAIDFVNELASSGSIYAALFNSDHQVWNEYGMTSRGHVRTILDLDVEQIRPLMFAVVRHLPVVEAKRSLKLFVAWSVRFLIAGGRGGMLDRQYGERAQDVASGRIKSAKELAESMAAVVPGDATFQAAVADARVSRSNLARYYLRAMERTVKEDPDPEQIPNDEEAINLEHILPETPGEGWEHIPPQVAGAYYKRLGNMALLKAKKNVNIGNAPFAKKRTVLRDSGFILTKEAATPNSWGVAEIVTRQKRLAAIATKTWPLSVT